MPEVRTLSPSRIAPGPYVFGPKERRRDPAEISRRRVRVRIQTRRPRPAPRQSPRSAGCPRTSAGLVAGMSGPQLGTKYVNWSVGQIVSHLADSHMNAFIRFKLALTEDNPTVKPYKEWEWSQSADAHEDPEFSLRILEGLHTRWVRLLRALPADDFARTFYHPERAPDLLPWARPSTSTPTTAGTTPAQIEWLKQHHGW